MKKGKSRNKRKKTRSRLLWIAIAVIGIAAVISAVCVAGMLATKENAWKTPEELLVEDEAQERMDILVRQMMDRQGITEELKVRDQMEWIRAVNGIRNMAEEIVLNELIYR